MATQNACERLKTASLRWALRLVRRLAVPCGSVWMQVCLPMCNVHHSPGFGVTVCTILLDQSMPVAIRQYMGTILTRIVIERHWDRSCPGQGANGLVPDADKARIRELIPSALGDASSKIRTQVVRTVLRSGTASSIHSCGGSVRGAGSSHGADRQP